MRSAPCLGSFTFLALLAGCAGDAPPAPIAAPPPPVQPSAPPAGLERVMGQDATTLLALLGPPALDLREGPARKLQFRGPACLLDVYLYPAAPGTALRATWIDARTPAGADFDRASCIAALVRR